MPLGGQSPSDEQRIWHRIEHSARFDPVEGIGQVKPISLQSGAQNPFAWQTPCWLELGSGQEGSSYASAVQRE